MSAACRHSPWFRATRQGAIALLPLLAACTPAARPRAAYLPRIRNVTVTTVPLLSKELAKTYPFLVKDFGPGGVLHDKEVYAFVPSTLTVVAGDTIQFEFVNPEDDPHSFVLPDLNVPLPPQSVTRATYIARRPGVFTFLCSIAAHLPSMWGQLVVLSPEAVSPAGEPGPDTAGARSP